MYIPELNRQSDVTAIHDLIARFGFATLITAGADGIVATPLPVLLDPARGPHGTLRSHMARANPHWRAFEAAAAGESLVIFQGPHAYVSPKWYVSTVAVPTWNYATVHAYGRPRVISDDAAVERLLADTVAHFESGIEAPWSAAGLPPDVGAGLRAQVVAFELEITRTDAKWKLGQNRRAADRRAAGEVLARSADPLAAETGRMMLGTLASE